MTRTLLRLAPFALVLLAGCPPSIIDLTYDPPTGSSSTTTTGSGTSSSGTAGAGGASSCTPGTTQPCYNGPAGTEGQGICKAGVQTCAIDGANWGPCVGEVLPQQQDNCATPEDEDCDGETPPCAGSVLWARHFGDASNQVMTGVAVDTAGNVFVTGYFFGSVDLGGGSLKSKGGADIFVAKLDAASGAHIWSRSFGDSGTQSGKSITVDATTGNVVLTGDFSGAVDFGAGALTSNDTSDVFVVVLDASSGSHIWSRKLGGGGNQNATGVTLDPVGNTLVTGYFSGSIDLGAGPVTAIGMSDAYVAKLDSAGGYLWGHHFGGPGAFTDGRTIVVDSAGSAFVAGSFSGAVDFGGGTLTATGTSDAYLLKLDAGGGHLSSAHFGSSGAMTSASSITATIAGGVLLTGGFAGTVDFGYGAVSSSGLSDTYLTNFGVPGWSKRFTGGAPSDISAGTTLAVDGESNVLLGGNFSGAVSFGGGQLLSAGGSDLFLAKLDAAGAHVWSKRFGDSAEQTVAGVVADSARNVIVAGTFSGSVAFDETLLVSAGGTDVFVAKMSP